MEWPLFNDATGKPQTTPTNQAIWQAALAPAAQEFPAEVAAWTSKLQKCRNWRHDYYDLIGEAVSIQCQCSPNVVLQMCDAGLEAAHQAFRFRTNTDTTMSVAEAFAARNDTTTTTTIETTTIYGSRSDVSNYQFELALPQNGAPMPTMATSAAAVAQLDAYASYGCLEPSAAELATRVCRMPNCAALVNTKIMVLLGATSEMGPIQSLLKIPGAHVLGVARSKAKLDQLAQQWHDEASTESCLQMPQHGADLLTQAPAIARWIVDLVRQSNRTQVVLYPLAYLDGEANVRVTVAMDAICTHVMQHLAQADSSKSCSLAYLTSPATVYAIPTDAAQDAQRRLWSTPWWHTMMQAFSLGQWLVSSGTWKAEARFGQVPINGLVRWQGPNYALAKTMQQWRCMRAAAGSDGRLVVAAPHAPPTRTLSVMHSPQAAAGLEGLVAFPPHVAFDVAACSTLMTAVVLQLLENAAPPAKLLEHPMQMFWHGAVHGGNWRCPYTTDSCGGPAYVTAKLPTFQWGAFPIAAMAAPASSQDDDDDEPV